MFAGQVGISQEDGWTALLDGIDSAPELLPFSIAFLLLLLFLLFLVQFGLGFWVFCLFIYLFYNLPWQCFPSWILVLLMTLSRHSYLSATLSSLSLLYRLFSSSFSNRVIRSLSQGCATQPHHYGASHSWHAWDKLQRGEERDNYTTLPFIFSTRKRTMKQGTETTAKTFLYAKISL